MMHHLHNDSGVNIQPLKSPTNLLSNNAYKNTVYLLSTHNSIVKYDCKDASLEAMNNTSSSQGILSILLLNETNSIVATKDILHLYSNHIIVSSLELVDWKSKLFSMFHISLDIHQYLLVVYFKSESRVKLISVNTQTNRIHSFKDITETNSTGVMSCACTEKELIVAWKGGTVIVYNLLIHGERLVATKLPENLLLVGSNVLSIHSVASINSTLSQWIIVTENATASSILTTQPTLEDQSIFQGNSLLLSELNLPVSKSTTGSFISLLSFSRYVHHVSQSDEIHCSMKNPSLFSISSINSTDYQLCISNRLSNQYSIIKFQVNQESINNHTNDESIIELSENKKERILGIRFNTSNELLILTANKKLSDNKSSGTIFFASSQDNIFNNVEHHRISMIGSLNNTGTSDLISLLIDLKQVMINRFDQLESSITLLASRVTNLEDRLKQ
jgi:hypothetical protein